MLLVDKIGGQFETHYTSLFGRLKASAFGKDQEFLVVNLNYDSLAEFAITNKLGFRNIHAYGKSRAGIALFHPHGSCNWTLRDVSSGEVTEPIVGTNRYKLAKPSRDLLRYGDNSQALQVSDPNYPARIPAIALTMSGDTAGKTALAEDHYYGLIERLPEVDSVVVIGWRGADMHIFEIIAEHLGNIKIAHLVGVSEPLGLNENLQSWNLPEDRTFLLAGGFRNYLNSNGDSNFETLLSSSLVA